jgi:hypothetical protein
MVLVRGRRNDWAPSLTALEPRGVLASDPLRDDDLLLDAPSRTSSKVGDPALGPEDEEEGVEAAGDAPDGDEAAGEEADGVAAAA